MFWRLGGFGFSNTSAIDQLLEKGTDVRLEEVLEEEELLQECKSHNPKLIEYLRDPKILQQLFQYIITQDLDEKIKQKYSYIACEILSCEIWSICETIMENKELLYEFWQFLERPVPLDPLQASYFVKVNEQFFEKKTKEMIFFIQSIPNILYKMLQHLETSAIMDLLLKMISIQQNNLGMVDWLQSESLIPYLLSKINPHIDPNTQSTATDVLKAIITISTGLENQGSIGPNALLQELASKESIEILVKFMLDTDAPFSSSSLVNGASIIIELIRKNNNDCDKASFIDFSFTKNTTTKDFIYLGTMLKILASHISDFQKILFNFRATKDEVEIAFDKTKPLGIERFRICELYAELLHCSNMTSLNESEYDLEVLRKSEISDKVKENTQLMKIIETSDTFSSQESCEVFNSEQTASWEDLSFKYIDSYETIENHEFSLNKNEDIENIFSEKITEIKSSALENTLDNGPEESSSMIPRINILENDINTNDNDLGNENMKLNRNLNYSQDDHDTLNTSLQNDSLDEKCIDIDEITSIQNNTNSVFEPVIGDYLKIQFIEHKVLPTILDMFFTFQWNNFLHSVVYDIIQQIFNGPMDRGYNKALVIDLFSQGKICERIVQGQKNNDNAVSKPCGIRLGYMGHLTLIAEEVIKFTERYHLHTLSPIIIEKISSDEWVDYVEHSLAKTREKDNAILGGVRPHHLALHSVTGFDNGLQDFMSNASDIDYDDDDDDDDDDLNRRINLFEIKDNNDKCDIIYMDDDKGFGNNQFSRYINQQITDDFSDKYEGSDDDDDDKEVSWIEENENFKQNEILNCSKYQEITDISCISEPLNDLFKEKIYNKYKESYINKNIGIDDFLILDKKRRKNSRQLSWF